jgi:DNA modification methylase
MYADGTQSKRRAILNDKMSSEAFYKFLYDVFVNLLQVTSGAFYVCMSSSELHNLYKAFTDAGGHWQTYIIWAKDHFTLSRSDYQHQFEPIMHGLSEDVALIAEKEAVPVMYGWSKHEWYGGRKQGDVWMVDRPKKSEEHPTMKPAALVGKAIVNSSSRGGIVIDLFGGSGSTLIASEALHRRCRMMELDPVYCQVIIDRYEKFTGRKASRAS